ncbi:hypothetical protein BGZ61DRAFT_583138 [Ilyonectria robusta]|uniref:uncharacterized protein n=1 Tax=Ilyonectria robusta TaxID=1079257 RepID=UPI001E8D77C3|nr:uncharacterized protein BGZ61DRAFT_583138 [Ilyonectria robusta]KAH8738161.1 hypothetical protein BGZ61DRAFT_583138 [Ilyonectria robusta]
MDPVLNLQAPEPAPVFSVTQAVEVTARQYGMTVEHFIDLFNLERAKENAQYGIMLQVERGTVNHPQPNMADNNVGVPLPQQGQVMNVQPAPVAQNLLVEQAPVQQAPLHPMYTAAVQGPGTGYAYNFNAPMEESPIALSDEDAEGEPIAPAPADDTQQTYHCAGPIPSLMGNCEYIIATVNPPPQVCHGLRLAQANIDRGTQMIALGIEMIKKVQNWRANVVPEHQKFLRHAKTPDVKLRVKGMLEDGFARASRDMAHGASLQRNGKLLLTNRHDDYLRAEVQVGNDAMFIERIRYLDTLESGVAKDALITSESRKRRRSFEEIYMATYRPGDDTQSIISYILRGRAWNFSYKEIKNLGGFDMADATMRGHVRNAVLTPREKARVVDWDERNVYLLLDAVAHFCGPDHASPKEASVTWKVIRDFIYQHDGERYSAAAAKKKWEQLQGGN